MRSVQPFRGLRYNLQIVSNPSDVITPPYDVISPEERSLFHRTSPYNIIRLEFGDEQPGDSADSNKYTRAAATLNDWLRDGVLVREEQPAFYIVEHRFSYLGDFKSRWGLICRVRLDEYENGRIRPHEQTAREPAVDRFNLLKSCRINISPIMGLVRSDGGRMANLLRNVGERTPEVNSTDTHGTTYSLKIITDNTAIDDLGTLLGDTVVYIADGHHRYETALRYRDEQRSLLPSYKGDEPFNFVMMSLMDSQDPGLVMSPTHRLVQGMEPYKLALLEETLSPYFEPAGLLSPLPDMTETMRTWLQTLETEGRHDVVLGLYGLHEKKLLLLKLRRDADLTSLMDRDELMLWNHSDVVLLQRIVFKAGLRIDSLEKQVRHLKYTRDALEAASRVDTGECQLAVFLNPAPVSSIFDAADAGRRLPQKSTYFHPKTPAGLVLNPLWEE